MSEAVSIICRSCKKHLRIAQAGGGGNALYSADPKIMSALKKFLFEHMDYWPHEASRHALAFGANQCLGDKGFGESNEGYEEVQCESG